MAGADRLTPATVLVLDQAACGLLRTDGDGLFVWVNAPFCAWVGYAREDLVGRLKLQELFTIGGRLFHQTHWHPLLQLQGSVAEVKLELVHRDGSRVSVMLNAIRRTEHGEITHDVAVYVARDRDAYERELVRARKRLEEAVAEAKRLHEQLSERAVFAEQMMGIVSHDLRNPLSTISMGAAVLARDVSASQLRVLERITRATERANRLISTLLDFTQAGLGGGLVIERRPIDLHAAVAETVDELAQAFPGRQLLHVRAGEGECLADLDRVAQLLGNLVANAVKYGSSDSPLTITSTIGERDFTMAVHNHGPPIAEDARALLFRPMTRGVTSVHAGGVGLGLFIVSEIAKAHAGSVSVDSTALEGTTFRARFSRA